MEGFKQKTEEKILEPRDQEISDILNSLEIKYEYFISGDGKLVRTFFNVKELDRSAFLLDANSKKIIYQALHFGEDKFEDPGNGRELEPNELMRYLSEKFPEADNIIFSCCNPDKARTFFAGMDNKIIFIGTGSGTFSTWHNDKEDTLSSVKN